MRQQPFFAILILGLAALPAAERPDADSLAQQVVAAHGGEAWFDHAVADFRLSLRFGGKPVFDGTRFRFAIDAAPARMELDAASVIHDGQQAWVAPADAEAPKGRFHVLTWPWFLRAAFTLQQPWQQLGAVGESELDGRPHWTVKQTFGDQVGDTPDDWYLIYVDQETHRIAAMAYIVTYAKTVEQAEQEAHAIRYHDYVDHDGVAIAQRWTFHHWNEEEGVHGEPIGDAELGDVKLHQTAPEQLFAVPEAARALPLPGASE